MKKIIRIDHQHEYQYFGKKIPDSGKPIPGFFGMSLNTFIE